MDGDDFHALYERHSPDVFRFAFGRIVSDTSWDVSPRKFIITASIAGVFWILFFFRTVRSLSALAPWLPPRK